ncbi:MAG TPA: adenylate/guanylate cyclase domain-containing protein [Candidatus Lustribacter sp.]|nr:adenylate/guanylate cyclase domain-containing protein [Candidatus Lustribacter sp.]
MKFPVIKIRRLRIFGIAMLLSALAAAIGVGLFFAPPTFASVSSIGDFVAINDALFAVRGQTWLTKLLHFPDTDPPNDNIRLVAIDEASLQDPPVGLGYPVQRTAIGDLLRKLAKGGAKIVAFDIEFFEHSHDPAVDVSFKDGLRKQATVLGMTLDVTQGGILSFEKPPPDIASLVHLGSTTVDNPGGWLVGQPYVITATNSTGQTTVYPTLALATASYWMGTTYSAIDDWHGKLGDYLVPLDGSGKLLMLPFNVSEHVDQAETNGVASRAGTADLSMPAIQEVSMIDALKFDPDTMKAFANNEVIVVGYTAQAAGDFILTPNGRYPGVFSNVRLMDQLMSHRFIRRVQPWIDVVLIIVLAFVIGFIVTQLRATLGVALAVGVALVYTAFAVGFYAYTLHWIDLIHVDGAIILSALFVALYRTITEGADKRVITEMFGKHVSPALVSRMLSHDDPLKALDLSGKRAKVTIFYSDIRGFTAMSEKMTPEQIYGQLNEYFEEMCRIVFEHGGYVDKFIGDCLMAVFSAPDPRPGTIDAVEATESAFRQQERIVEMMTEWQAQGRQLFTVGMGLNTGEVVMGNLGSSDRLNYTVIGDNVNTAARLYNVAKGGQTIISEATYNEVKDHFIVNELTPVFVKGKVLPLRNFELIARLKPGEPNTSTLLDPENLPEAYTADAH